MRQSSDGRDTMQTRGDAYAVGERVFGAIDGCPGEVVSVGDSTFTVDWTDAGGADAVVYPKDTIMVRRAFPWE